MNNIRNKIALIFIFLIAIYNAYIYIEYNEVNKKLILINIIALIIYLYPMFTNKIKKP